MTLNYFFRVFCSYSGPLMLCSSKIRQSSHDTLGQWDNCLIHQAMPSSIFFIISCKSFWENPFNWYFYYFTRMKMNTFECPKSKPTTYCTWTIRPLVDERIDPATQHIIWKIVRFLATLVYIYNTLTHRKLLPAADAYFSQSPSIKSFGGIFSH